MSPSCCWRDLMISSAQTAGCYNARDPDPIREGSIGLLGAIATDPVQSSPSVAPLLMCRRLQARLFERLGPPVPWNRTTYTGLVILVVLWAARMYATWATWGNLTIDGGHEMYVPAVLSEGKMLYRDIWWQYTPLSVYLNAYLFRLFGENLNVLYWAGSLSALASALLLYAAGMRLSSWLAGWTTAAIVIIQAFNPYIFCFPLPYSFAAVYGCLAACLFVFFALLAAHSDQWMWTFGAASTAALALLDKLEFGAACYATLLVLIAARCIQQHSWKRIGRDFLAILPGATVCGLVAAWMISIRGVEFITQENIISWPTTYYMKTYGKMWLAATGFAINGPALGQAALRTALVAAVFAEICMVLRRARSERRAIFTLTLVVVAVACVIGVWRPQAETVFRSIFLPRDMVLYVVIAALAACWYFWEQRTETALAAALLLTFSALLAFRILLGMNVSDYPIYYNGPVILGFLLLAPSLLPRSARSSQVVLQRQFLICSVCLTAAVLHIGVFPKRKDLVPLTTSRGTIRVSKLMAERYGLAIAFMKEKAARGEAVLSLPEDTSLYFLSGTYCPTRVFMFVPGLLVPGKMTDELIAEIERAPVRYLIWSNRTFWEMGAPNFGTDFDRPLGDYLRTHYRFVRPLAPPPMGEWDAGIYERRPDSELPDKVAANH